MIAPAAIGSVEVLHYPHETQRALAALQKMGGAAPSVTVSVTHEYRGGSDLLILWGPGAPNRQAAMQAHQQSGGHLVVVDLAYWDRQRKVRVSIDAPHPQAWVMRKAWPTARVQADHIRVADLWNPEGPILIAGIGDKARVQYGEAVDRWEAEMTTVCRARWPGRPVIYRRKPKAPPEQIEGALQDVSLVVTWHSNVAVDAIRMGIPVVCRDGAAAAVCPSDVPVHPTPLPLQVRDRFLANLAYFQWNPQTEAAALWAWLLELLA